MQDTTQYPYDRITAEEWLNNAGRISKAPILYDVYRTSDRRIEASAVKANEAARIANTSVNFVVLSAKKNARNAYGRVATETGYYFYLHSKVPDKEADSSIKDKRKGWQPRTEASEPSGPCWVLDKNLLAERAKDCGYESIRELCEHCGVTPLTIYRYTGKLGVARVPATNANVKAICKELGCRPQELFFRKTDK